MFISSYIIFQLLTLWAPEQTVFPGMLTLASLLTVTAFNNLCRGNDVANSLGATSKLLPFFLQ